MSEPRPEPEGEVAGESEYGNDTGFAAGATGSTGSTGSTTDPPEDADDDPGRGAD